MADCTRYGNATVIRYHRQGCSGNNRLPNVPRAGKGIRSRGGSLRLSFAASRLRSMLGGRNFFLRFGLCIGRRQEDSVDVSQEPAAAMESTRYSCKLSATPPAQNTFPAITTRVRDGRWFGESVRSP